MIQNTSPLPQKRKISYVCTKKASERRKNYCILERKPTIWHLSLGMKQFKHFYQSSYVYFFLFQLIIIYFEIVIEMQSSKEKGQSIFTKTVKSSY